MVKKLVLNCNFPSGTVPVNFFIGNPNGDSHPIGFQSEWLAQEYGGKVPSEIMDSMEKLHEISIKNKLSFEDLCEHVFKEVNAINDINKEKATKNKQLEQIKKIDPVAAKRNATPQQAAQVTTKQAPTPKKSLNNQPLADE